MSPLRTRRLLALVAGLVIAAVVAGALDPAAFLRAYLLAWLMWLGVALGGFALLCVHHLVAGRWGAAIRPHLSAAARTVPLLALLFVPIALGVHLLYPWSDPALLTAGPLRAVKGDYLDPAMFIVRAAVVLLAWCLLARPLARPGPLRPGLAGLALVVLLFTVTVGAVDWLLSLDPDTSLSAVGLGLFTGDAVAGLAFVVLLTSFGAAGRRLAPERRHELGNLLLTAVMLWAYIAFTQYLLVWSGDLPYQSAWYLLRTRGAWLWVSWALIALHFAVPFLLLLFRPIKRRPAALAGIAVLLLGMRVVELAWFIVPTRPIPRLQWQDPLALLAVGGVWLVAYLGLLPRGPAPAAEEPHGE